MNLLMANVPAEVSSTIKTTWLYSLQYDVNTNLVLKR